MIISAIFRELIALNASKFLSVARAETEREPHNKMNISNKEITFFILSFLSLDYLIISQERQKENIFAKLFNSVDRTYINDIIY